MENIFYVHDYICPGKSDSDAAEACIREANKCVCRKTIVFDRKDYFLDRAVEVPDNTDVIIDGCCIGQNDRVFDNVFRGANLTVDPQNPYGTPLHVLPQKNIRILGQNGAMVKGTDVPLTGYHPVLKEYQSMTGDFWGWRTLMFSFSLGENIEIGGLKLRQTMCWALSFDSCCHVYVHDLDIRSDVKNGDGVDFRSGCHDCRVENITGYTSDDTVACTALATLGRKSYPFRNYLYPLEPYNSMGLDGCRDISNITIKNIYTGGMMHGIICLAACGNQVYDIRIDNVPEEAEGGRVSTVKIYTGYGDGYRKGDLHDITVSNVKSSMARYSVEIDAETENVSLYHIEQNNENGERFLGISEEMMKGEKL